MSFISLYIFDEKTRIYKKCVETQQKPQGVSYPKDSTFISPLDPKTDFCVVFKEDESGWEYLENHLGDVGYVDGERVIIDMPGPYPVGWVTEMPPKYFKEVQLERVDILRKDYKNKIIAGFDYQYGDDFFHVSYDEDAQSNFSKRNSEVLLYMVMGKMDQQIGWKAWKYNEAGEPIIPFQPVFSIEIFINFALYAQKYHQEGLEKELWGIEEQLLEAKSVAELDEIYPIVS